MPVTRDEIAAGFGRQAQRYGYRRASVDELARTLHISKQTIYEQFGSKQGLYRASVELWAAQQRQRVESLLTLTTALGRITEATLIAFDDARRGFAANPYGDDTEPSEIIAEVNARVFGPMLRDLIVQGNESGELRVKDPEMTAAFAVVLGVEAVRMMREDASGRVEEAALDAIRRLVAGVVQ